MKVRIKLGSKVLQLVIAVPNPFTYYTGQQFFGFFFNISSNMSYFF